MSLLTSLVESWELDEASGNAVGSHAGLTLTETSGIIGSAAGPGGVGGSRDFEAGDTEWFERASEAAVQAGDIDFTFETWVNPESTTGAPVILSKHALTAAGQEYVLFLSSGVPTFDVKDSSSNNGRVQWGAALSAGTWYQVVCWHDSVNNVTGIAVNAGTPVTAAWSAGVRAGSNPFQVGASSSQGLYWDGLIAKVRFWKRVLTSGERTTLYNSGAGLPYSSFGGGGGAVPKGQWYYRLIH